VEEIGITTHFLWYVGRSLSVILITRVWSSWGPGAVPNASTSSELSAVGKVLGSGFPTAGGGPV
jgi:hypothetical protein